MLKKIILITLCSFAFLGCATQKIAKEMAIEKMKEPVMMDDSSPVFSGNVKVQMLFDSHPPSNLTGANVTFSPKARSAWHYHPMGQLLVVNEGEGLVQEWGKPVRTIKKGDIVWTPPGIKHWHGACLDKSLSHTALQEKKFGKNVVWLEKVTDEEYKKIIKKNFE